MHDSRVNIIVANAFNGSGDATGSDDFGFSVAWIDLDDFVENMTYEDIPVRENDSDALSAYLKTWKDIDGCRYALAYVDADGSRSAVGYTTREDMMKAFRDIEADFLAWDDDPDWVLTPVNIV